MPTSESNMESSTEAVPLQSETHRNGLSVDSEPSTDAEKHADIWAVSAWKPGAVRRFPLFGLFPLMLSIACTCIAAAIVVLSNNTPVDGWWSGLRQPGVLLAYTSTIANALLAIAFAEATVIFFWTRAVRGKMSTGDFHYYWKGSTGIVGAFKALSQKRAIRVSIVSIFVTITALLRGPLVQRASYVQNIDAQVPGTISLPVSLGIGDDWGGSVHGRAPVLRFSKDFSMTLADFMAKTPIQFAGSKCQNCTLQVQGFGFDATDCTILFVDNFNFTVPKLAEGATLFTSSIKLPENVRSTPEDNGTIHIDVKRKGTDGCAGDMVQHICELKPALVTYNMKLDGDIATFESTSWKDDSVVRLVDLTIPPTDPGVSTAYTTLDPLQRVGSKLWDSSTMSYFGGAVGWTTSKDELLPNMFYAGNGNGDPCDEWFEDPMDYIINNYRELAFRMSVVAGLNAENKTWQTVAYTSHLVQTQYAASIPALILAVIISLLGPLATLILFWGWWNLGRGFSMSPLELANAILGQELQTSSETTRGDNSQLKLSSIFSSCSSNVSADKLASQISQKVSEPTEDRGEQTLQYGVLESTGRLAFGFTKSGLVREPKKGELL